MQLEGFGDIRTSKHWNRTQISTSMSQMLAAAYNPKFKVGP